MDNMVCLPKGKAPRLEAEHPLTRFRVNDAILPLHSSPVRN